MEDHEDKKHRDGEERRKRHRERRQHGAESSRDRDQTENRKRRRDPAHNDAHEDSHVERKQENPDKVKRRREHKTNDEKSERPEKSLRREHEHRSRHDHENEESKKESEINPVSYKSRFGTEVKDEKRHRHPFRKEKEAMTLDQVSEDAHGKAKHDLGNKPLKRLDDHLKIKPLKKGGSHLISSILKKQVDHVKGKRPRPRFIKKEPIDKKVKSAEPTPMEGLAGRRVRLNSVVSGGGPADHTGEFSDSDDWSDVEEDYDGERDDEWLGTQREKALPKPKPRRKTLFLNKKSTLELGCSEFMDAMKYFWWWLKLGGRMPFQTYTADRIINFKLNIHSFAFMYFALTSGFLTLCTTTMAFSLIRIFLIGSDREISLYQQVERLEVDKYWVYALLTLITCTISSSVSLALIFDDGYVLADFLTRWNLAISTIKYRPVKGLRMHFYINMVLFVIYATVLIVLFNIDERSPYYVPTVRGASGLIGTCIFLPFAPRIRFSPLFPHVETLGLFVHLYSAYSSKAILLMVTLYCKALVNMARRWNLRLAYVLGTLNKHMKSERIVAVISFPKLFVEHTVIVGFLRHTGRVFAVGLGIFYSLKIVELVVLGYRVMSYLIFPLPIFNETIVPGTPEYLPKISYTDPPAFLIGTSIVMLLLNVSEWFITSRLITACGDTILDGFSHVRRFGLILSKTSQRRRFVQSLNHAFSHATDYYIKSTFTIHRPFIFDMFFWIVTILALLTAFSPFQLQSDVVTVCSESGNCVMVQRTRVAWRSGGSESSKEQIAEQANAEIKIIEAAIMTDFPITEEPTTEIVTTTTTPTTTTTTPSTTTTTPSTTTTTPSTTTTTPTTTTTTTTTTTPTTTTTTPTTTTTTPTTTTTTPTTTTTTPSTTRATTTPTIPPNRTCSGSWFRNRFNQVVFPNICKDGKVYSPYKTGDGKCVGRGNAEEIPFMGPFLNVMDCETRTPLKKGQPDDCKNIPLPHLTKRGVLATMVPVRPDGPDDVVICCYDYGAGTRQLRRCNQAYTDCIEKLSRKMKTGILDRPFILDDLDSSVLGCIEGSTWPPGKDCAKVRSCLCSTSPTVFLPLPIPFMPPPKIKCK